MPKHKEKMVGLSDVKNEVDYEVENLSGFYSGFKLEKNEVELVKNFGRFFR